MEKIEELEQRLLELEKKQGIKEEIDCEEYLIKVEKKEETKEVDAYNLKGGERQGVTLNDKEVKVKELVKNLDNIYILGRGQTLGYAPTTKIDNSEVWACNNVFKAREVDRLFIMHDIYMVQFLRDKTLIDDINKKDFPVYTLGKYDILKNNVNYPIEAILKEFNTTYLINNASYMLALAILQKPKNIILFGIDMAFGTNNEYLYNEKACVEFWLGMAKGKGIDFAISEGSTLMKRKGVNNYYGMKDTYDGMVCRLEPDYTWGSKTAKSTLKYKIIKVQHKL